MPDTTSILAELDRLAGNFEFPGFNNMNYETADSRLHCYRDGDRWALVIEELVDWPGADGLMTLVFAMGAKGGDALTSHCPVETQLIDDEGEPAIPDHVVVRGQRVPVDQTELEATCEEHDVEPTFAVLLQLIETRRDALFSTDEELANAIAPGLIRILTLDEWSHPDVYGGPKPSEAQVFQQLSAVLATGEVSQYAPAERPNNRDWQAWLASR